MSDRLVVGYQRLCGTPEGQLARLFFDIQLFHPTFPERSGRLGNIIFWQNNSRSVTLSFGLTRPLTAHFPPEIEQQKRPAPSQLKIYGYVFGVILNQLYFFTLCYTSHMD
ncbi:hypothetical protein QYE77_10560 [Thermanaerothrix sp. 4228-RoL]|uniref:Uncharacterized protein n=1 Tax=Thermanaerothrix solaris TaxID=3058434 RepID=A0ABU3NPF5_9CHLR|nr:hypothetical protein [Thermanaerothrix sp. 4228-RoL]MDT8898711.1 hypothetical protein [Thermanaerothrix sp. 4228-RoL]